MRFYLVWNLLSVRVTAWLASRQRSEGREGGGGERQQQVRSATVRVLSSSQQQTNINTKQGLSWLPRSRIWSTPPPPPAPTSTGKPFGQFLSILIKPCRTTSDPALSVQHWQLYQTPCILFADYVWNITKIFQWFVQRGEERRSDEITTSHYQLWKEF